MRDQLSMEKAVLEAALHGHAFGLRHELAALTAGAGLDEGAPAIVLNDELIAEDLGDLTLDRDFAPVAHGRDRGRRKHHHGRASDL